MRVRLEEEARRRGGREARRFSEKAAAEGREREGRRGTWSMSALFSSPSCETGAGPRDFILGNRG